MVRHSIMVKNLGGLHLGHVDGCIQSVLCCLRDNHNDV